MPTKRNSAGQQQPYVPEGHGDASGEYAEHATGSNQHYVSPDDVKRQLGYGGEQPKQETAPSQPQSSNKVEKELGKKPEDTINTIYKNLDKGDLGVDEKNKIKNILSIGDKDCNNLIEKTIQKNNVLYMKASKENYYRPKSNEIFLTKKSFEDKDYSEGGTFYHETGHMIDNNNEFAKKNDYSVRYGRYRYLSDTGASTNFVSSKYNTTIAEMLRQECKENISFEKIKQEKENYKQSIIQKEFGENLERYNQYKNEIENDNTQLSQEFEEIKNERDELSKKFWNNELPYNEYEAQRTLISSKITDFANKKLEHLTKIREKYNDVYSIEEQAYTKASQLGNIKYGDISDVISGATQGRLDLGMGHPASYWKKAKIHREKEFFAEAFSAKATNKESYEVLKQYLPKTMEIFEECLGVLGK